MICNLTAESFYRFGRITGKGHEPIRANRHSISLSLGNSWTYRCDAPTWVANESGIAILSVSADGTAYRDFYLDKPVRLHGGVVFSLIPLQQTAVVQMSAYSMPRHIGNRVRSTHFEVQPQVYIKKL